MRRKEIQRGMIVSKRELEFEVKSRPIPSFMRYVLLMLELYPLPFDFIRPPVTLGLTIDLS